MQDERTLLIPDRRGNNRIDSLRNILADPRVFFQCARAIQRSKLWEAPASAAAVPTVGAILQALTDGAIDARKYDEELPVRQRATLY